MSGMYRKYYDNPFLTDNTGYLMFDVRNTQEMMTAPECSELLAKYVHRDATKGEGCAHTSNDTPDSFRTCKFPPRNEKVSKRK
jgi:hypothetical protein